MNRLKNSYSTCMSCGGKKMKSGGKWIQSAIKKPGSFTAQAKKAGMSVPAFRDKVLSNKEAYSPTTVKRANLAKTLSKMRKGEDGMKVSKKEVKEARKDVMAIEPKGITTNSVNLTTPTPIESPANWYNESTWDTAQAENAARPAVGNPVVSQPSATTSKTPLARGGSEKVRAYQEMLRSKGYDIAADGAWGPKTQQAYETYIKSKTVSSAPKEAAKTTSKASSETWNYTPEQWDKSMAENKARPAVNSVMATADNMKKTPINTKEVLKTPEPIQVTQAVNNVSKLKKAKSKVSSAEALIRRKVAKMNSGKSIYGD
jgi:hypothetical protein